MVNSKNGNDSNSWVAKLNLKFGTRHGKTCIIDKNQFGPLTLQKSFYPEGPVCHNYILHPPSGVVGRDKLFLNIESEDGSHALITTPGATKFYRSKNEERSYVSNKLKINRNSKLEWLPQQNIFFNGARTDIETSIDIEDEGMFIGWEINCFGRPANKDFFSLGSINSQTSIFLDGKLTLIDQIYIDNTYTINLSSGLRGMPFQATLIAAKCDTILLDYINVFLKEKIGKNENFGVTLIDGILVLRTIGEKSEFIIEMLKMVWDVLREKWLELSTNYPRIWNT